MNYIAVTMSKTSYTLLAMLALSVASARAEQADSTKVGKTQERHNRNVMLDASATVKPRDIPIGLPSEAGGTLIMEDGMPVGTTPGPIYPYSHWVGGSSYAKMDLMSIEETLLRTENLGFSVDSYTALGTDSLQGTFAAKTNNDGMFSVDVNLNGPIARGWYFTAGAYIYFDPTSVHPKHNTFVNKTRIYKAGLTHRWGQSEASLLYKLTAAFEGLLGSNHGPFVYNGDGTIGKLNGFHLGRDSYMPADVDFSYLDLMTGEMKPVNYNDENKAYIHDLHFRMTNQLSERWGLDTRLHVTGTKDMAYAGIYETGIDSIKNGKDAQGKSITSANDQSAYSGLMQRRMLIDARVDFLEGQAQTELVRRSQGHATHLGLSYWFLYQYMRGTDASFAQTVEADPVRLFRDGQRQWSMNTIAQYGRGRDHYLSLFAIDDWQLTPKLNIYYGMRADLLVRNYDVAVDNDGLHNNERHDGFYLYDGTATITKYKNTKMNLFGVARAQYQLLPAFFLSGEYIFSRAQRRLEEYMFDVLPSEDPYVKQLIRGGVSYTNSWLNASLMASYITCRNINTTQVFTKQINGVSESQGKNVTYDIGTLGITADATATIGNFNMHMLITYQEPKYRNFVVPLTFSDKSTETLVYSDKYVTGMSKVLLELDPSYTWGDWRLWVSARYYSRQYASQVNNVYFNGHWETFAGLDWQTTRQLSLSLSVTNLLNQSGASGSISAANTITDIRQLMGYKTAGSFIRPFTIGLSAVYKF